MRKILFRGKRTDNGEWVYGDLRHGGYVDGDPQMYIMQTDYALHNIPIIPETVGQYTGLVDKNGTKIFEGDILKDDWGKTYKVIFTLKSCSFMVECMITPNEYEKGRYRIGEKWCETIAVIGNIHDDPELLEVEYVTCKSKRDVRINHQ